MQLGRGIQGSDAHPSDVSDPKSLLSKGVKAHRLARRRTNIDSNRHRASRYRTESETNVSYEASGRRYRPLEISRVLGAAFSAVNPGKTLISQCPNRVRLIVLAPGADACRASCREVSAIACALIGLRLADDTITAHAEGEADNAVADVSLAQHAGSVNTRDPRSSTDR